MKSICSMSALCCVWGVTLSNAAAQAPVVVDASKYETLQAAADALPASGGVLMIPSGTHEISQPLRIKTGDTRIVGQGTASHIVNKNTSGEPALLIENPQFAGKATPTAERLWRVNVANLRLTGNERSGPGIEARYIEEILIEGVSSSYHGGDGVRLHFCYEDPRIVHCLFTYNKKCGVALEGCHDIIVSANQFEENQDALHCIDSFNLAMSGNNLDDHLGHGVIIENTYGSVVASNMIEECQGWGIILDRDCYGITLSANVIAHEFAGGIDLRDAHGCTVSANTFTIVKQVGLAVRSESGSIVVTGNNFSDSLIGRDEAGKPLHKRDSAAPTKLEKNPNEAAGIVLEGCRDVVITGNMFSGLTTEAVTQAPETVGVVLQANAIVSIPTAP